MRRAGRADHRATGLPRRGPVLAGSTGEVAWVDMLAGRILVTSLAAGTTRVIDVPGPVAAMVRPRAGGGLVVAGETGVWLLDEANSPTFLCEVEHSPNIRLNEGSCDAQGRFWIGACTTNSPPGPRSSTGSIPTGARGHLAGGDDLERPRLDDRWRDRLLRRFDRRRRRHVRVRRRRRHAQRSAALRRHRPEPRHARRPRRRRRGRSVGGAVGWLGRLPPLARGQARRRDRAPLRASHGVLVRRRRAFDRVVHHDLAPRPPRRQGSGGRVAVPLPSPACAGRP